MAGTWSHGFARLRGAGETESPLTSFLPRFRRNAGLATASVGPRPCGTPRRVPEPGPRRRVSAAFACVAVGGEVAVDSESKRRPVSLNGKQPPGLLKPWGSGRTRQAAWDELPCQTAPPKSPARTQPASPGSPRPAPLQPGFAGTRALSSQRPRTPRSLVKHGHVPCAEANDVPQVWSSLCRASCR